MGTVISVVVEVDLFFTAIAFVMDGKAMAIVRCLNSMTDMLQALLAIA